MTTTHIERVSDGEELVFTGATPHTHTEIDPRDRILTHRSGAIGGTDAPASRERPEPSGPVV